MIDEIIDRNISVFSRELQQLQKRKVKPVEKISALQHHVKAFEKARTIPQVCRNDWVSLLVERARKDPDLADDLKGRLVDVYC